MSPVAAFKRARAGRHGGSGAGAAGDFFLALNQNGWESNRTLAIGIGGGLGWFMMLNVWGIVWRMQKKIIRWKRRPWLDGTQFRRRPPVAQIRRAWPG